MASSHDNDFIPLIIVGVLRQDAHIIHGGDSFSSKVLFKRSM
jgi:hypothetical protein